MNSNTILFCVMWVDYKYNNWLSICGMNGWLSVLYKLHLASSPNYINVNKFIIIRSSVITSEIIIRHVSDDINIIWPCNYSFCLYHLWLGHFKSPNTMGLAVMFYFWGHSISIAPLLERLYSVMWYQGHRVHGCGGSIASL
jgi:hypothetical protein